MKNVLKRVKKLLRKVKRFFTRINQCMIKYLNDEHLEKENKHLSDELNFYKNKSDKNADKKVKEYIKELKNQNK